MAIIFFDSRWVGEHGIGRFAAALQERLELETFRLCGSPSSPMDPLRMLAKVWRLPLGAVAFSPGYNAPLVIVRPYVFTVHDLNHIDVAENSSVAKRLYYQLVIKQACKRASRVLTVSEFSRRRLINWAGVAAEKVVNVGNGVDRAFGPEGDRHEPGFPYLLSVGNRKPHKNEVRALVAFAQADISENIHIVFTGRASLELITLAEELRVADRVRFLGHIEEEELPSLYRGALGLLFPSLYEGFGLPVVEAMACGTPVLTSNVAAIPEVAGDAALLVDPFDVESIREGIERLVGNASLREWLRAKGLERVSMFSWDDVARQVGKVLEEVGGKEGCSD